MNVFALSLFVYVLTKAGMGIFGCFTSFILRLFLRTVFWLVNLLYGNIKVKRKKNLISSLRPKKRELLAEK